MTVYDQLYCNVYISCNHRYCGYQIGCERDVSKFTVIYLFMYISQYLEKNGKEELKKIAKDHKQKSIKD